jgi:peptidoglycan/LPS O-acetylase OafA/YrhL
MDRALNDDGASSSNRLTTRRRGDIQGLRALAVILVALNHAGVGFLKGGYVGVDVFFVLSGYLITGVLVSSAGNGRPRSFFSTFYAHRARRILPAAVLTLVVTDVAASHLLNLYRAHQVLTDSISATFFVANVHFASIGTNYFAMGQPPSPLQHFWSLSVEEQFYLVWPFLVAVVLLGTALGRPREYRNHSISQGALRGLRIVAVMITATSLAYAVYDTHHSVVAAYFSTPARAWELGLGALLALNTSRAARLPSAARALIGWVGITAILLASTVYSASTPFPGVAALLPTLGCVAVIAAGVAVQQASFAPSRILSLRPFRYVGDRSYTFYLWHWPVLILVMEHVGHNLSITTNLLLLACAFVLSIGTYAFFENPIRRTPKLRTSLALGLWPAAILVVFAVSSDNWSAYQDAVNLASSVSVPTESLAAQVQPAATISAKAPSPEASPASPSALVAAVATVKQAGRIPTSLDPSPLSLKSDLYHLPKHCIAESGETHSSICRYGVTSSAKMLMVVGDSHAQMWMPAIISFAQHHGYDVRPVMKIGCNPWRWAGVELVGECNTWYKWAVAQVRALQPALLILAAHYDVTQREAEIEFTGPHSIMNISAFGAAVQSSARQIVVLGDPPGQTQQPVDCLLAAHATMRTCSSSPIPGQIETNAGVESAAKSFGGFLDTTPWLCYQNVCPMVVGHTVVYVDTNHITTRYAEELAPLFDNALQQALARSTRPTPHRSSSARQRPVSRHVHTARRP